MSCRILSLLCAAMVAACSPRDAERVPPLQGPYGVWLSNKDFSVIITKKNVYYFCSSDDCVSGPVLRPNKNYVWLKDFYKKNLSKDFDAEAYLNSEVAGAYRRAAQGTNNPYDLNFSTAENLPGADWSQCGGNPCIRFGDKAEGLVFRLVKSYSGE